jgi:hypothetical protein
MDIINTFNSDNDEFTGTPSEFLKPFQPIGRHSEVQSPAPIAFHGVIRLRDILFF